MRRPALFLAALLVPAGLAFAQAPTPSPAPAADPVLARVDGQEIRVSDLELEFRRLPEELRNMPPAMLQPLLLDQMITHRAIVNVARARGLDRDAEVVARVRRAEEETLQQALLLREVQPLLTNEANRTR
jgi:peptidyl-prolyl cis-trans isomerase C